MSYLDSVTVDELLSYRTYTPEESRLIQAVWDAAILAAAEKANEVASCGETEPRAACFVAAEIRDSIFTLRKPQAANISPS